jgi:Fic family protein
LLFFEPIKLKNQLMAYNWQQKDWPFFTYSLEELECKLLDFAKQTGHLSGTLQSLPSKEQVDFIVATMLSEALKTSAIEGEYFSREDVVSSIRNNMGLNTIPEKVSDQRASGIAELMVDARNTFNEPLSNVKLFDWHRMLMKGNLRINIGMWRTDEAPMQIISGAIGKEKVHFEAPPSQSVPAEMDRFIKWFNNTSPIGPDYIIHAPVRAAIAHLYFESIHPFEDGNGRIGRAIAEKALSQNIGRPILFSLSQAIEADKKMYYQALQSNSKSNAITPWVAYFVSLLLDAQGQAEKQIQFVLSKTKYFDRFENQLNPRQLKVIKNMLEHGTDGFVGGMSARKYASIAKTSKATATRDLQQLLGLGALLVEGDGRSTRYYMNI